MPADWRGIGYTALTRQQRDEVALQHRLQVRIDVAVLVVAHGAQQLLDEFHLIGFVPFDEYREARFAFRLEGGRQFFFARRIVQIGRGILGPEREKANCRLVITNRWTRQNMNCIMQMFSCVRLRIADDDDVHENKVNVHCVMFCRAYSLVLVH